MPPTYKPLTTAGGIQGAPNLAPEIFNPPAAIDLNDAIKTNALIRAQQLSNQNSEITVTNNQRVLDQQTALRDALKAKYGAIDDTQEFNPDEALQIAQKIALQNGDLDTALNVTKAQRSMMNSSNRVLAPEEIQSLRENGLDLPDGSTLAEARLHISLGNSGIAAGNLSLRATDPMRTVNQQRATGTQFQKLADGELTKLQNADGALQGISEVKDLLPQMDVGALSALKAGKVTDLYKDPGSPAYRTYARLELLKKQVARMNDSGALTQLDVDMFAPMTLGSPIYDDQFSLNQRMDDLARYIADKQESIIKTNEQGYRNMDRFRIPRVSGSQQGNVGGNQQNTSSEIQDPPLANYGAPGKQEQQGGGLPRNPDGSPLTREQFIARMNGGR